MQKLFPLFALVSPRNRRSPRRHLPVPPSPVPVHLARQMSKVPLSTQMPPLQPVLCAHACRQVALEQYPLGAPVVASVRHLPPLHCPSLVQGAPSVS